MPASVVASRAGAPGVRVLDRWTAVALLAALVGRPLLFCLLPLGETLVFPILEGDRSRWWVFHLLILSMQWIPVALIGLMLARTGQSWSSLGVDWAWFGRRRWWLAALLLVLGASALAMPSVLYPAGLPATSGTIFLAPVSGVERLFILLVAASAGIGEELQYRGLPLTRLAPVLGSAWWVLPITMVSFLYIHGEPRSVQMAVNYLMAGAAFGIPFILMGLKRLEILIVVHFLIDAAMVFAP